ncbi:hypothetical protein ATANTOWER_019701 [Ataeniobius toweri]|uniref:Uncharacterized protein n=1 Tax=Ataeniobius toweri TaxID=208326 RepID=A0ABU7BTI3_9TELE|nr:hypothetical protein [Ataeniobius toweri]
MLRPPHAGNFTNLQGEKRAVNKIFGWTIVQKATELEINHLDISPIVPLMIIPTWILPDSDVDLTTLERKIRDITFIYDSLTDSAHMYPSIDQVIFLLERAYPDSHSSPVGGGNAPNCCLPTAKKKTKKKKKTWLLMAK